MFSTVVLNVNGGGKQSATGGTVCDVSDDSNVATGEYLVNLSHLSAQLDFTTPEKYFIRAPSGEVFKEESQPSHL